MPVGELIMVDEQLHQFYPQATDIGTQGCYNVGSLGCWFNLDEFHTTGITAVMGFWANK
ncbi:MULTISPECIES: hypothetical protein [Moorena]|uniref:Uncharacterized protein n=1 Tax=Moorena producens 3L TaxID=489825 RepID=F4XPW9_9CYAN|nr:MULTISPECIES: hypothetical protein [Moorena]EGJ33336.1 hypothetical protein LYNGBM3L_37210 [Moorena producens 3L]NEP37075.1 hypothetical protein [Moorena sp. SIO3B2]NEP66439.1 hypothetical protein [Moorena sp. SIO3A5]NER90123.1 hypothetical protein [Moorena sp. SIO3A2]NET66338.1 hypothetical protein [Moorena sp. SIO1G6]